MNTTFQTAKIPKSFFLRYPVGNIAAMTAADTTLKREITCVSDATESMLRNKG